MRYFAALMVAFYLVTGCAEQVASSSSQSAASLPEFPPFGSDYSKEFRGPDFELYVHVPSTVVNKFEISGWRLISFNNEPNQSCGNCWSLLDYYTLDCISNMEKVTKWISFSGQKMSGKILFSKDLKYTREMEKGTFSEMFRNRVCAPLDVYLLFRQP